MNMTKVTAGALALGLAGMAWAVETVELPALPAPGIVDGDLADPSWAKAYRTAPFTPVKADGAATEETVAWLYRDEACLYVGVKCAFADYALREKIVAENVKSGFYGDCIELFVDPGDTGNCAHIGLNVAGAMTANGLVAPIKAAVQLHEKDWTAEFAIPFDAIKVEGDSFGREWRLNVARGNYKKGETSSWSKLENGAFHDLPAFNRVKGIPADLVAIAKRQKAAVRKDFEIATDRLVYSGENTAKATLDFLYDKPIKGFTAKVRVEAVAKPRDFGRAGVPSPAADGDGTPSLPGFASAAVGKFEKVEKLTAFHTDFAIPLKDFADGRYEATLSVVNAKGETVKSGSLTFWKIPPAKARAGDDTYVIRNHCVYRNGEFHFPIITWKLGWNDWKSEEEFIRRTEEELEEMRQCGFTADMTSMLNFPEEDIDALTKAGAWKMITWEWDRFRNAKKAGWTFETYCRLAKKHGIAVIAQSPYLWKDPTPYTIDRFVDHVTRIRNAPNVMCWHTSDEQDGRVEYNMLLNRLYHEIDPTRFTWINTINGVAANKYAADVLSSDPYPIPGGRVTGVASHADRLVANTEGRPEVGRWLWIQNFGGEGSWTRPPTPDEVKCMAMLAVNHGATGLAYFNWVPPEKRNGVRQHKDGTALYPAFNAHLRKWTPALCQGKVVFRGRQGVLDVLAVEFEGRKVLSVVNVEKDPVKAAKAVVPGFAEKTFSLGAFGTQVVELPEFRP